VSEQAGMGVHGGEGPLPLGGTQATSPPHMFSFKF
jgi:hypothetical protein